jgi:O-methyltransferase
MVSVGSASRARRTWRDVEAILGFLASSHRELPFTARYALTRRLRAISSAIDCPHTESEMLSYIGTILSLDASTPGCVVEAGCYKGGSTAKFSIAAKAVRRELVVFDSFEGIPRHDEDHGRNIFGKPVTFAEGEYAGSLEEVTRNVGIYGEVASCRFIKGWFKDTLPGFHEPIAAIYLDVDLAESTRTCLTYLYPLLQPGGTLYSQDGHLPLVLEVFADQAFWRDEVGYPKPDVQGWGTSKLLKVVKSHQARRRPGKD